MNQENSQKRTIRPKPRFNEPEFEIVRQNAALLKMPVETYIRHASINLNIPKPVPVLLNETLFELQRQGKNLNQIAHRLNINSNLYYYLKSEYEQVISSFNELNKTYHEIGIYWKDLIQKL